MEGAYDGHICNISPCADHVQETSDRRSSSGRVREKSPRRQRRLNFFANKEVTPVDGVETRLRLTYSVRGAAATVTGRRRWPRP
eukprot:6189537-Pleurochrysis_carterae.AAC.1